jgi:flagellar basal body-associated protein FliL
MFDPDESRTPAQAAAVKWITLVIGVVLLAVAIYVLVRSI